MELGLSFCTIPFAGLCVAITKAQVGRSKDLDGSAAAQEHIPIESCGPCTLIYPMTHIQNFIVTKDDFERWWHELTISLEVVRKCRQLILADDDIYLIEQLHLAFVTVREAIQCLQFVDV